MTVPRSTGPDCVQATFDGEPIEAAPGASVAAALVANGRTAWRSTGWGEARGVFCGVGVWFGCVVEMGGGSGQRACMIPLTEGMRIRPAVSAGDPDAEHAAAEHEGEAR